MARLKQLGDQLHQPLKFSGQQENLLVTSTPNYTLHGIFVNLSETLILGVGGFGPPRSPPNPYPPPSGREYFDKEISSFEQSQTSNNSHTSAQMTNQNNLAKPWLDQDVVVVSGPQHPLPKHPEKFLPNFDPDSK